MALQKLIELDNGITPNYWVVESVLLAVTKDAVMDYGTIRVDLYKDETARRNDKRPADKRTFTIDPVAFLLHTDANVYITAYNILKQLDEFAGSTDV